MEDQLKMSQKQVHSLIEDVTHTQAALNDVNSVSDSHAMTTNGFPLLHNFVTIFIAVSQTISYFICCKIFGFSFDHDFCPNNSSMSNRAEKRCR